MRLKAKFPGEAGEYTVYIEVVEIGDHIALGLDANGPGVCLFDTKTGQSLLLQHYWPLTLQQIADARAAVQAAKWRWTQNMGPRLSPDWRELCRTVEVALRASPLHPLADEITQLQQEQQRCIADLDSVTALLDAAVCRVRVGHRDPPREVYEDSEPPLLEE